MFADNTIDSFDIIIAKDLFTTGTPEEPVMRWVAERGLYSRLQANSLLIGQDPSMSTFYNAKQTDKVGLYQSVEDNMLALYEVSPTELAQFKSNGEQIFAYLDTLIIIDSLMVGASPSELTTLANDRDVVLDNMYQLEQQNASLDSIIQAARATQVQLVQSQNAALSATTVYEQNEKTYNEIWLDLVENDTLTQAQIDHLEAISWQCPLEGGEATLKARGLYVSVSGSNANFKDEMICDGIEERGSSTQLQEERAHAVFSLFPNPAKDEVELVLQPTDLLKSPDRVVITDISGHQIAMYPLQGEHVKTTLTIQQIPPGIYFVKVFSGKTNLGVQKLMIAK